MVGFSAYFHPVLAGVEQGKTSLQILQTNSTGATIPVCFDPMSGIWTSIWSSGPERNT